jgi:prefoldin alpha subunit
MSTAPPPNSSKSNSSSVASLTPHPVRISDLPTQQLSSLKKQIDDDLATLTSSHTSLRAAVSKFRDCIRSIEGALPSASSKEKKDPKEVLVPLTESLYVTGTLGGSSTEEETVLVDVGTGFFVEKNREQAIKFYEGRVKEVSDKVGEVEEVIRNKSEMVGVLEEGEFLGRVQVGVGADLE